MVVNCTLESGVQIINYIILKNRMQLIIINRLFGEVEAETDKVCSGNEIGDGRTEDFHPGVTVDQAEGLCHRITLHFGRLNIETGALYCCI